MVLDRTVYIEGPFDDNMAYSVIQQIEFFDSISSEDIYLPVHSYGGSVPALLAMYHAAKKAKSDIVTVAVGTVMSAGAFCVIGLGTPGKRLSLPNTQFMLHEARGMAERSETGLRPMRHYNKILFDMMSEMWGRPAEEILKELERDVYKWPEEALALKWIDAIVQEPQLDL
ncbi:hypothetical protein [Vibrio phage vB_VmeM-Yong XC32]|nr:hypothetical protein [Vibrio phage vB_VmeM-Yong XC31]QAX96347.1 hypothetical protein [Vibrio phage vB_VmeM-Yong XC32]QAX96665.1 hypothetical protein [Vibrio phage vB_VmeM-Yong MS31]QAX96983.1 hypothetical protein [Vibrio phage vB_VmeM-Yong MS32]